jgi:hypothetical protein
MLLSTEHQGTPENPVGWLKGGNCTETVLVAQAVRAAILRAQEPPAGPRYIELPPLWQ